ncbi:hypothetical protein B0E37_01663 [Streptomyces sp. MH192]|nr:hypothetical protein [Streptomyces sp. MH192]MCF0098760.1 hypothetical protein [Streptomyces sp. MH191]
MLAARARPHLRGSACWERRNGTVDGGRGRRAHTRIVRAYGTGHAVVLSVIRPKLARAVSSDASAAFPPREPVTAGFATAVAP